MGKGKMDWLTGEIELAFESDDCPICRLIGEAEERYFFWLAREGIGDGKTREKLIRNDETFCRPHARRLIAAVEKSGRRLSAANTALRLLDHWQDRLSDGDNQLLPGCGACRSLDESQHNIIMTFAENLSNGEFAKRYALSQGLCRFHLRIMLEAAPSRAARAAILRIEQEQYLRLRAELEESIRKSGAESASEPKGAEMQSWKRSLIKLSGSAINRRASHNT